jgi:hypothetical protein
MTEATKSLSPFTAAPGVPEVPHRSMISLLSGSRFEKGASFGFSPSGASTRPSKPPDCGIKAPSAGAAPVFREVDPLTVPLRPPKNGVL